ncbi:MAG: hypothetical protein ACFFCQ_13100 [Promethearchaeota archaeon]
MTEKVSFYVDPKIWHEFKTRVFNQRGSLKGLSEELELILLEALPIKLKVILKEKITTTTENFSSNQIKKERPKTGLSSSDLIRQERDSQ